MLKTCGDDYHQVEGFAKLKQMIPEYIKVWKIKQKAKTMSNVFGTCIKIKDKEIELLVNYR
jgi:hypothetical protein